MSTESDTAYLQGYYRAVDSQTGLDGLDPRRQYYVPIYSNAGMDSFDLVPRMRRAIQFSAGQSLQLLSGFRGCGKTSELLRLIGDLDREGYQVVYMDIEDYFNTLLPLDAARLPFALAAGFANALDTDPSRGALTRFWEFVRRVRPEVSAKLGTEGAGIDVKAVVRDDTSFAHGVEEAFRLNRRVVREQFHAFFADLLDRLDPDRPVVFVVDSIDHWRGVTLDFETVRDSVEMAFTQLGPDLQIPGVNVIYTVPIYLALPAVAALARADVVNIKLATRTGARFEPGYTSLRQVLAKRAPGGDVDRLLPGPLTDRLITASGGQFRDLLRLMRLVILESPETPTTEATLRKAEMTLRNEYASVLSTEQLDLLRRVNATKEAFTPRSASSDEAALVTLGAILRYPNDESTWYDVHPLLLPLLD